MKQIPQEARLRLAEAILLVNEWQETGGSPRLIELAQEKMAGFGVTFAEDAKPEAAAALALLLFGDPDTKMPGGFSSAELSATSPIKAIASFPQELVLLGRATILIKGISKRLGIKWDLATKWKAMAQTSLECGTDGCLMPTWAAVPCPAQLDRQALGGASSSSSSAATATSGGSGRTRFRDVTKLAGKWAVGKGASVVPAPVKRWAIKKVADRIE